ncbi:MAG: FKBP-type peptidyl-prolyl cis-trans isomerase [Verrucomicrobia bacterium]|nr:MAG: FKBP-type peptidyl-prolyl cis-trans isomerase [Verrucomicrobiota bacterium]
MKLVRLMQVSSLAAVGALSSVNASAVEAAAPTAAASEPVSVAVPAYTDEQVFEAFGYLVGQRIGISEFNLTEAEKAAALKGLDAAFSGTKDKFSPETFGPEIQRVLGGRQQAAAAKASAAAESESAAFFAELKKNPKILTTPSGLHYEVIEAGSGDKPKPEDTVKVHYTGTLVNGTKFDSSVDRGEPAEFPLNGVIPGWTEGLQLVGVGGKLKLYIPSKLGYGEQGAGGSIPPNATLVFDVELLEIKPAAAAPAAPEAPAAEAAPAMN